MCLQIKVIQNVLALGAYGEIHGLPDRRVSELNALLYAASFTIPDQFILRPSTLFTLFTPTFKTIMSTSTHLSPVLKHTIAMR